MLINVPVSLKTFLYQFIRNFSIIGILLVLAELQFLAEMHVRFFSMQNAFSFAGMTAFLLLLVIPISIYSFYKIKSYVVEIGADGVTIKQGVFVHSKSFIPWTRIQDVTLSMNILERVFAFATLSIDTAAKQPIFSQSKVECLMADMAEELQKMILDRVNKNSN